MGKLATQLTGTAVNAFVTQPLPTGGSFDCAGLYGSTCGSPTPKWRHVFLATWATPWAGLDLTAKWRYIGPENQDSTSSNALLSKPYFPAGAHYQAWNYIDVAASMPVATGVTVRVGVNNIADRLPPLAYNGNYSNCPSSTCNDNTWVGTYDTMGRYMYAHVSVQF
jgi:outer membrane receptor protein involved in Fe transport